MNKQTAGCYKPNKNIATLRDRRPLVYVTVVVIKVWYLCVYAF